MGPPLLRITGHVPQMCGQKTIPSRFIRKSREAIGFFYAVNFENVRWSTLQAPLCRNGCCVNKKKYPFFSLFITQVFEKVQMLNAKYRVRITQTASNLTSSSYPYEWINIENSSFYPPYSPTWINPWPRVKNAIKFPNGNNLALLIGDFTCRIVREHAQRI